MPIIQFTGGEMSPEMKNELVRELTHTASSVTGVPEEFFSVTILELGSDNLGLGGKTVSEIKAERAAGH